MRMVDLSPSRDEPYGFSYGSVEKGNMMWVLKTDKLIAPLCLKQEQQHKQNSTLSGAACCRTPISREEKWSQAGAASPPQETLLSVCNGTYAPGQQESFWRDEEGQVSRATLTLVVVQSPQSGGSHSHQKTLGVSTAEVHVTDLSIFSNWFFKAKEVVNLERMTRCAVYSVGPGLRGIYFEFCLRLHL